MKCANCNQEKLDGTIRAYYVGRCDSEYLGESGFLREKCYKTTYNMNSFKREEHLFCADCEKNELLKNANSWFWIFVLFIAMSVFWLLLVLLSENPNMKALNKPFQVTVTLGLILLLMLLAWGFQVLKNHPDSRLTLVRLLKWAIGGKSDSVAFLDEAFKKKYRGGHRYAYYDAEAYESSIKCGLPPYDID